MYTITYYDGGTVLKTTDPIFFEADISGAEYNYTPAKPTGKEDYTWGGWYADSELQQPYTVELRMPGSMPFRPDETPPEETVAGRQLLRLAWRNGFVRTQAAAEAGFLFRYVGKAHAIAMTYLDVGLEDYLTILHSKEQLTIQDGGETYYIQCIPAQSGYNVFHIPAGAVCEASMDNTGYAVIACTLPNKQ
jgi:hypothetical protein